MLLLRKIRLLIPCYNFKHLIIGLMAIIAIMDGYSQGSWESRDFPIKNNLNDLCFVDSLTGWVVGDSGIILKTINGGYEWTIQNSYTSNNIVSVYFVDEDYGWAAAHDFTSLPYGTELLSTKNGGDDWFLYEYPEDNVFTTSLFFHDTITGWMGGTPHLLAKTEDGGQSWTQSTIDTSALAFFPVLNLQFYDTIHGYASGGLFDIAGVIWITKNGGESWSAISPDYAPADEIHGLHIFNPMKIMGSGGDPDFGFGVGFINTGNGGQSWTYDEIGVLGIAYDIDFPNENEGWAPLGPEQNMIYTLDTGYTWVVIPSPENFEIFDIQFTDEDHGYGVGRDGAFIAYRPGTVSTDASIISQNINVQPNPALASSEIHISLSPNLRREYKITVYSIDGRFITNIENHTPTSIGKKYIIKEGQLESGSFIIVINDKSGKFVSSQLLLVH